MGFVSVIIVSALFALGLPLVLLWSSDGPLYRPSLAVTILVAQ